MSDQENELQLIMGNRRLSLVEGDITKLAVDAIVNAANERLQHGGGVAAAISRKGGPVIQKESDEWVKAHGPVKTGSAAYTHAGMLKAKYVIHAVGPIYGSGQEDEKLASAVRSSLALAEELGVKSIAFPAISAGIFGFPMDRCARIMIREIADYLRRAGTVKEVMLCLWGERALIIFKEALREFKKSFSN
ncbi:MAG: macro domain-containing protein [candidate division KSB1 bacterium]|nr:macro domain-containing protein [candidate division KSB1 bacterium]MDZ7347122.1 macro domain-containing protein [candidate division KSB1 bacterium]